MMKHNSMLKISWRNKKLVSITSIFLSTIILTTSVSADYRFRSGGSDFGGSTSTDYPVSKNDSQKNIRRNKDVTDFPPAYGVFSGDFDTDATNPYVDRQTEEEEFSDWGFGLTGDSAGDFMAPTSTSTLTVSYLSNINENISSSNITEVTYLANGTIGSLTVPSLNKTVNIYEDTTIENMRKGLGHATYTSAWDGNVGVFGHNRGDYAYFGFLKDLKKNDVVTYTTAYGTRNYAVSGIYTISVDDTSFLDWSSENTLTMITCIANQPNYRLCVVAKIVN